MPAFNINSNVIIILLGLLCVVALKSKPRFLCAVTDLKYRAFFIAQKIRKEFLL